MHLSLLAIGVFLGRALYDYPSVAPNLSSDQTPVTQDSNMFATASSKGKAMNTVHPVVTNDSKSMSQSPIAHTKVEHEALGLIAKFESLDQQAYLDYMTEDNGTFREIELGRDLTIALLNLLPTVNDSTARERLNFLLKTEGSRLFDVNGGLHNRSYLDEWLMNKVKQYDQRSLWLETLAQTGLNNIDDINYLLAEIPVLVLPEDRVNVLKSLESNMSLFRPDTEGVAAIQSLSAMTAPYFMDADERVRAAAVGTLHVVRDNKRVRDQLLSALRDRSMLVRSKAANVIASKRLSSPEIQQQLFTDMLDESLPPLVRITASEAASVLPLNLQQRQELSRFMKQEYPGLDRELREAQRCDGC